MSEGRGEGLHPQDRQAYIDRYESRLRQFGYAPETLGWGKKGRQETRFAVLSAEIIQHPEASVLDVGCGFADLHEFLTQHGWRGRYTGIDIVPSLLDIAKQRHPGVDLRCVDLGNFSADSAYDYVVASGVFNAKISAEDNLRYIRRSLVRMFKIARIAVCVDFLSTYVDFKDPIAWHTDPSWALTVAKELSKRVALRHDYMPFEFSLFVYRDQEISNRNVFAGFSLS